MKNNFKIMILTAILIAAAFTLTSSAQNCASFRNRTYIAFGETVFDNPAGDTSLRGAFTFKVKFDADGKKGTARFLTAQNPSDANAMQQNMKFTCSETGSFTLSVKAEGDNAYLLFKSFDRGAKIWVKSNIPGRDTPFWMIELPADPSGEQFPKK